MTTPHRKLTTRVALAAAIAMAAADVGVAQVYQVQQGNVLDANPRLGSGGINPAAPTYNYNAANRIVTGNVSLGQSFRGFSPIQDPSVLFLPGRQAILGASGIPSGIVGVPTGNASSVNLGGLPSNQLSNFRRDSYNLYDYRAGGYAVPQSRAYYSTSSTVTDTGAISAGLNRPGTSQIRDPYEIPQPDAARRSQNPLDAASGGSLLGSPTQLVRYDNGQPLSGTIDTRLLGSNLFRGVRQIPLGELAQDALQAQNLGAVSAMPLDLRIAALEPLDLRVSGNLADREQLNQAVTARPGAPIPDEPFDAGLDGTGGIRATGNLARRVGPEPANAPVTPDDLQRILQHGEAERPAGSRLSPADRAAIAQQAYREPLRTFVGTEESQINNYLAKAEDLLRNGKYYDAADYYELAFAIDAGDPIPLLGRAMALLAAGEYMSSAHNLFRAIRLSESGIALQVDLKAFIPDINTLDRRRADLETRLDALENFRLRFLLGYAEYCTGFKDLGVANMRQALADADSVDLTALRRFLDTLTTDPTRPIDLTR